MASGSMEGPLSKWTNVVKGWQYRWFVLDENAALLSYYTSKEKMKRGARRGCIRLKGSVVGIDDEEESTFTITVEKRTFHFQARDADEKERWIVALENTIVRHSQPVKSWAGQNAVPTAEDFDKKLAETDVYLQVLIDQVKSLEDKILVCDSEQSRQKYTSIRQPAEAMIESIKQTIVLLQISKKNTSNKGVSGSSSNATVVLATGVTGDGVLLSNGHLASSSTSTQSLPAQKDPGVMPAAGVSQCWQSDSFSSSDDENFYDAEEDTGKVMKEDHAHAPPVITSPDDYPDDELYDVVDESDLDSLDSHGSLITHLLSQVRIGMDLSRVVLPTFILEKRSLLEMYADFLAHPDLFSQISEQKTPRDRMVQVVKWYLSAFHASRRCEVAKKPYNPILGETFQCFYRVPGHSEEEEQGEVTDGPVPWCPRNSVSFLSEQVSHHPPISAFYAENQDKKIALDGYIWTKSKFLGLSVGVYMIGQAALSVLDHGEEYIITFPNVYGRSILTVPWVELGGKMSVTCAESGYNATIDFHTKPFYGGKKDQISAEIYAPSEKKPFCSVRGEWNGIMWAKFTDSPTQNEVFVDTTRMPVVKKQVRPRDQQGEYESRKLWEKVTTHLKDNKVEQATKCKHWLEQRQRDEAKERQATNTKWETKHFHEVGEHWVYDKPLVKRLSS